jgi:hypothetical protein
MLIDKGFTHAICNEVLKDNPEDKNAKKLLDSLPENNIRIGTEIFDLDKIKIEDLINYFPKFYIKESKNEDING